jgi:hypothetical protein
MLVVEKTPGASKRREQSRIIIFINGTLSFEIVIASFEK